MMQKNKPKRRVVTKKAYLSRLSAKTTMASIGLGIFLFGVIAGLMALLIGSFLLFHFSLGNLLVSMFMLALFGGGGAYLLYFGGRMVKDAKAIEVGVPLTRANTGNLSVVESLVRPSQEPVHEQRKILLRAAANTDATPTDQLVRAFHEPVSELVPEPHTALNTTTSESITLHEPLERISIGSNQT